MEPDLPRAQPPHVAGSGGAASGLDALPPAAAGDADLRSLRRLEARVARVERYLGLVPLSDAELAAMLRENTGAPPPTRISEPGSAEAGFETSIGEFWLARIGVLALSTGLAFLVAYPFATLPSLVPVALGYGAAGIFFAASRRWRRTLPDTAPILFGGALFLLFFATLRLHFFAANPVVPGRAFGLAAIVAVLGVEFALVMRRRSEFMTGLVFLLGLAAAVIAGAAWFQFCLITVLAGVVCALSWRNAWSRLGLVAAGLTYLVHLDWLFSHVAFGRPAQGLVAPEGNLTALFLYAALYAALGCRPGVEREHPALRASRALLISGGAMLVVLINVQLFHRAEPPWVEVLAGAAFLAAAFLHWRNHQSVYATSVYSCAGYLVLSAAIIRHFPSPDCFAWLAWQGLLVAATAVLFRSKIVIVANLFIFGGIYLIYLVLAPARGAVNLSFAIVALLTARVLNWQKDRLKLRTETMRNIYLGAASIVIPYGLYHTVPPGWVSSSWLLAAGFYFVASAVLHNRKYRWMGMGTILATIGYVFIVDLARLEPAYRIVSFLVLGAVLLGVSVTYARRRREQRTETED
jgi:uncharacterized membrane protein